MGRSLYIFDNMLLKIIQRPDLFVCDMNMMSIFGDLLDELLHFK